MKRFLSLFALSGVLAVAAPARADIIYTFASASFKGTLGTEQTYYSPAGQNAISTYGFDSTLNGSSLTLGKATDLYAKYSGVGSSETGLGIAGLSDYEINNKSTVELNMSTVLKANPTSSVTLTIGSVQQTEGYAVYGGAAGPTTELGSFTNHNSSPTQFSFTITAAEAASSGGVFYVTAPTGNVLIDTVDIKTAAVPEPAAITMALTGLGLVGGFSWLRRRSARA